MIRQIRLINQNNQNADYFIDRIMCAWMNCSQNVNRLRSSRNLLFLFLFIKLSISCTHSAHEFLWNCLPDNWHCAVCSCAPTHFSSLFLTFFHLQFYLLEFVVQRPMRNEIIQEHKIKSPNVGLHCSEINL